MYIIIAIISGILVVTNNLVNSTLAKKIGVFQGVFINYFGALIVSSVFLVINKELFAFKEMTKWGIPWWACLGGVVGVSVVAITNVVMPKIPVIYSTLLIFVGQIFLGLVIDYFSSADISIGRILGAIIVVGGLTYNMLAEKREEKNKIAINSTTAVESE